MKVLSFSTLFLILCVISPLSQAEWHDYIDETGMITGVRALASLAIDYMLARSE